MAAVVEHENVAAVAASALADARSALLSPRGDRPPGIAEADEQLRDLGEQLRASLLDTDGEDGEAVVARLELVYVVGKRRERLGERALFDRLDVLADIQESLAELRNCNTREEMIETAPRELCRSCGFTRALISRVHGSRWVPEVLETSPGIDPDATTFAHCITGTEIRLEHLLPETELVRRRMPAVVADAATSPLSVDRHSLSDRTETYVAAPIMPSGRVIGFLHADRIGQEHSVTTEDRDDVWTFAQEFGSLYERAVLAERLCAQREQLRRAFANAEDVVEELWHRQIELAGGAPHTPEVVRTSAALFQPPESRLDARMTRREREVLELLISGLTNTRIAEQLVISEGTVKSHVKHILRKLRAGNRAEAVARYLQIRLREEERRGP